MKVSLLLHFLTRIDAKNLEMPSEYFCPDLLHPSSYPKIKNLWDGDQYTSAFLAHSNFSWRKTLSQFIVCFLYSNYFHLFLFCSPQTVAVARTGRSASALTASVRTVPVRTRNEQDKKRTGKAGTRTRTGTGQEGENIHEIVR